MANKNNKKGNLHPILKSKKTFGQRAADYVTRWVGSWSFIIGLSILLFVWIIINLLMVINKWDPYPFILLNFVLSALAAFQAPVILMSQNRQTERDRITAKYDYLINRKAEREIQDIKYSLDEIKVLVKKFEKKFIKR